MPGIVLDAMTAAEEVGDRGFTFASGSGEERVMSFRELAQAARQQAAVLQAHGLVPGDRVTLIIPGQRSFVITFLAALAARLVPVAVYPPSSLAKLDSWRQTAEVIVRAARPAAADVPRHGPDRMRAGAPAGATAHGVPVRAAIGSAPQSATRRQDRSHLATSEREIRRTERAEAKCGANVAVAR